MKVNYSQVDIQEAVIDAMNSGLGEFMYQDPYSMRRRSRPQ